MTTAHRPTFDTARGGQSMRERDLSAQSKQYSSRDLPSHTRLKYRQEGQGTAEDARVSSRDFKRDLEDRERRHRGHAGGDEPATSSASSKRARLTDGAGAAAGASSGSLPANLDADDAAVAAADLDSDADSDDEADEDEAAELMAELAKIRREREAEAARREAERQADEERIRTENILKGNPLLNKTKLAGVAGSSGADGAGGGAVDFKVKRRWNDDVVFKNCARDDDNGGRQRPASFINDTLRSEFHKKFMDKYIK